MAYYEPGPKLNSWHYFASVGTMKWILASEFFEKSISHR